VLAIRKLGVKNVVCCFTGCEIVYALLDTATPSLCNLWRLASSHCAVEFVTLSIDVFVSQITTRHTPITHLASLSNIAQGVSLILYTSLTPLTLPSFRSSMPSRTPFNPPLPTFGGCTEI